MVGVEGQRQRKRHILPCFLQPCPPSPNPYSSEWYAYGVWGLPGAVVHLQKKRKLFPQVFSRHPLPLGMVLNTVPKSIQIRPFTAVLQHAHKPKNVSLHATSCPFTGCLTHATCTLNSSTHAGLASKEHWFALPTKLL